MENITEVEEAAAAIPRGGHRNGATGAEEVTLGPRDVLNGPSPSKAISTSRGLLMARSPRPGTSTSRHRPRSARGSTDATSPFVGM